MVGRVRGDGGVPLHDQPHRQERQDHRRLTAPASNHQGPFGAFSFGWRGWREGCARCPVASPSTAGTLGSAEGRLSRVVVMVSESGLYSLILKSRKPAAKAFQKWVTAVV